MSLGSNARLTSFDRRLVIIAALIFLPVALFVDIQTGGHWRDWIAPTAVLSVIALIIGFASLHWQLERQHDNTLQAHRLQAENKLKLEIYDRIAERLEAAKRTLGVAIY